jgi:hypothetical protein
VLKEMLMREEAVNLTFGLTFSEVYSFNGWCTLGLLPSTITQLLDDLRQVRVNGPTFQKGQNNVICKILARE